MVLFSYSNFKSKKIERKKVSHSSKKLSGIFGLRNPWPPKGKDAPGGDKFNVPGVSTKFWSGQLDKNEGF